MPNTSIYGLPVSCTSISFTLPLFRTVTGHDYLYPAVATARVISVPIPPSAPVMIASFMFTKYKLPIIRKIQSPLRFYFSISFSSRQAVLPANADGKPFLWNTSGLCSNYYAYSCNGHSPPCAYGSQSPVR